MHLMSYSRWSQGLTRFSADCVRLFGEKIVEDIEEFSAEDAFFWNPSELLKTMAAQGQMFEDLNQ